MVNSYLKKVSPLEGAIKLPITSQLIISILSRHLTDFVLTEAQFNVLNCIVPTRLDLPLKNKEDFVKLVGKYARKGEPKISGAYVFINKISGYSYVGSSIALHNRLSTGYLAPKIGNRKIDLAIKCEGLTSFYLDLYVLSQELIQNLGKIQLRNLVLALEQILMLKINPELNVLKVAGSVAGNKRSSESMQPALLKCSKPVYFYDTATKQLIFIANSRVDLCKILGISVGNLPTGLFSFL